MTAINKTLKKLRVLRKELAGIGFEITIGKSEYLDEAALIDTPGDVFPYRFVSVLPDGRMSWEDVNYDQRKDSFEVFHEEFLQRLAEEYEYRAEDKRRAWLALCDDEEALAVRLGERLRELKPYSDVLDRMFTGFSDRLPNGERADTGWAPPTSTAVMDDGLRERMRRAIGARTWQEFLDAVYRLGLFRED